MYINILYCFTFRLFTPWFLRLFPPCTIVAIIFSAPQFLWPFLSCTVIIVIIFFFIIFVFITIFLIILFSIIIYKNYGSKLANINIAYSATCNTLLLIHQPLWLFELLSSSCGNDHLPSMYCCSRAIIAERRERSKANNRVLFEIPRYLYIYIYIYIYMSVCKCIVQDRAHLTQVLSRRPLCIWNTGCCSAHYFEESPFR